MWGYKIELNVDGIKEINYERFIVLPFEHWESIRITKIGSSLVLS